MNVKVIVLIMTVVAFIVLLLGDALYAWAPGSLPSGQIAFFILLAVIPISLGLFAFLAHRQEE